MEMNHEYASKGVAGAGLGTGIAGLSLGVLNSLGGLGALGGLIGNRSNTAAQNDILTALLTAGMVQGRPGVVPCGGEAPVTQREAELMHKLSEKDAQIALRDADTYTDQKMLELYKYIDGKFSLVEQQMAGQAVQNQANKDSFQLLQERMECIRGQALSAVQAEAAARKGADDILVNYVNSTFYPRQTALFTTGTGTFPQPLYDPLSACGCGMSVPAVPAAAAKDSGTAAT